MDLAKVKAQVQDLVKKGNPRAAIEFLLSLLEEDHESYLKALHLSARIQDLFHRNNSGTIRNESYSLELNNINNALLELGSNQDLVIKKDFRKEIDGIETLRLAIARVSALKIFQNNNASIGLTIRDIHEKSKLIKRKEIVKSIHEMEVINFLSKLKTEGLTYYKLTKKGREFITEYQDIEVFK